MNMVEGGKKMQRKLFLVLLAGAMCLCLSPVNVRADALHYPTETIFYDPSISYGGLHLINPLSSVVTYLIDMDGRLVHKWVRTSATGTITTATMEENGLLSRSVAIPAPSNVDPTIAALIGGAGADGGLLEEVSWTGKVVHTWNTWTSQYYAHHRYQRIFNKKYATILFEKIF